VLDTLPALGAVLNAGEGAHLAAGRLDAKSGIAYFPIVARGTERTGRKSGVELAEVQRLKVEAKVGLHGRQFDTNVLDAHFQRCNLLRRQLPEGEISRVPEDCVCGR